MRIVIVAALLLTGCVSRNRITVEPAIDGYWSACGGAYCGWGSTEQEARKQCANFPTTGEVSSACDAVAVPVKLRAADPKCSRCRGGGWWYPTPGRVAVCPCRTVAS